MKRRDVLNGVTMTAAALPSSARADSNRPVFYDEAVNPVWRDLDENGGLAEIVRPATLPANSHNTQPWRFPITEKQIKIAADLARRCPAVDPDDHHLFASLGCAIVQAAPVLGFKIEEELAGDPRRRLEFTFDRAMQRSSGLASAIRKRQSTRGPCDGRVLGNDDLKILDDASTQATALGIRLAFINQPVEVPSLRQQIASFLGIGSRRPSLLVRFGRGPALPPSLRRPIDAIIDRG